jgi:predicted CxxxxCH...CXXCH cytochrome family protein
VVMVPWTDNAMLHNSNRFAGTTKHTGTWGQPGSYGGGIVCGTCHAKNTNNIKKIKNTISLPGGEPMPGGGGAVSFQTVVEGSSDLGDDSTAPRAASTNVCEVCHTADLTQAAGVDQHASDQAADSGHFNNADCISCHEHKRGFEATCDSCHGNPPINATSGGPDGLDNSVGTGSDTAGKHDLHANTLGYVCITCHNGGEIGGEMPNGGDINLGFANPGLPGANYFPGGNYDGRAAGSYFTDGSSTVSYGNTRGCSALYCHGSATPTWNVAGSAACGTCHGDGTGVPTTT